LRGTVKDLAQLDGAYVVADDGTVRAACRYLDASVENVATRKKPSITVEVAATPLHPS